MARSDEHETVITAVTFTVARPPVSTNRAYRTLRDKPGMYISREGKDFAHAVRSEALAAKMKARWTHSGEPVEVRIEAWNYRGDVDGIIKPILDAMQGVLYENDRSVLRVTASKESDAGKPRTVVFVRLKEKSPA